MFDSPRVGPIHLLNSDTYLNHLLPTESVGYEVLRNLNFVVGGIALWDVLVYLRADIKIVRNNRFSFAIFCFIASRIFALAYIWSAAMYSAAVDMIGIPIRIALIIQVSFYMLSKMASSFLFLQRVLAVCHNEKWIQRGFSILWLLAFLSEITTILGGSPTYIPGTIKFGDFGIRPWTSPSFYLLLLFDTGVVVVVAYKIWLAQRETWDPEIQSIPQWYGNWVFAEAFGEAPLWQLSRSILMGQVHYYMITVGVVAMTSVIMSIPTFPQVYKAFFPPSVLFFTSSMACRVFRNLKSLNTSVITSM